MRVIQCFRAPLGGLFRHVADLTRAFAARGIEVGIVCDASDYGDLNRKRLEELKQHCAMGVQRLPMPRQIGWRDANAVAAIRRIARDTQADIVHGHGAKGGAYARLAVAGLKADAVYTPHGGSLHFPARSPEGFVFLTLEKLLRRLAPAVLFESEFSRRTYTDKVGRPPALSTVIHNGLSRAEFADIRPAQSPADILFIGEMRELKGPFVLLDALARLNGSRPVSALFVGTGPDKTAIVQRVRELGLDARIAFSPPMPARDAFARARIMAVPSLAESLPYIVLEAAAAGMPMVATDVGGIPEIFGDARDALVPAGDAVALAEALDEALRDARAARALAARVRMRVSAEFSLDRMASSVLGVYGRIRALPDRDRIRQAVRSSG